MEGKILLYDSNDNKIGETFVRRARQLVKQQRASWIDDNREAIRFAPGMENMDEIEVQPLHSTEDANDADITDNELMKLARRRVHARFAFTLHRAIVLMLCVFFVFLYLLTDPGGYFWPIWPMFGLGASIAIHWVVYKLVSSDDMHNKIAHEYEQLKHSQLYGKDSKI